MDIAKSCLMSSHEKALGTITECTPESLLILLQNVLFWSQITKLLRENCQAALNDRLSTKTTKSRIKTTYYFGGFGQERNDARMPD